VISRIAIVILAFILSVNKAFSLSNTTSEQPDTGKVSQKRPLIATGLSVVLPGAGQIYNKQYWKPPLFWASMAGGAYLYHSQHKLYKSFSNAYDLKSNYLKNPTLSSDPYPQHSLEYLETWRNRHKLLRNLGLFTLGASYMVNVVDAYASAQTHHNPRAATSVATNTSIRPCLNLFNTDIHSIKYDPQALKLQETGKIFMPSEMNISKNKEKPRKGFFSFSILRGKTDVDNKPI